MTLAEFKAWLEGYSEAIDGAPTEGQWKKVLEKLEDVQPFEFKPSDISYPNVFYNNPPRLELTGEPVPNFTYTTCGSTQ